MVMNINAVVSSLNVSRASRIAAALAIGLWVGLAAASAGIGLFTRLFPYIGFFVAFPLVATAALAVASPAWRAALFNLPTPLLIGLNVSRVFGVFFLLLAAAGRLSGPFPVSAGWGDIATGLLAILALVIALKPAQGGRPWLAAWNAFGALDLVVAVALGVASAEDSPLQLFDVGSGSAAVQMLPWSFVPTVLVPFYLIMHAILAVQLRQAAKWDGRNRLLSTAA